MLISEKIFVFSCVWLLFYNVIPFRAVTSSSQVLLEKPPVVQLFKNFPIFIGT
jgi:hypothetical protein